MMHLEFQVDDAALGATKAADQPQESVRVLFDPAEHPFCLCRDSG
jgi:hypothetical protein